LQANLQDFLDFGVGVEVLRNLGLQCEPGRKHLPGGTGRNLRYGRFRTPFVIEPHATELVRQRERLAGLRFRKLLLEEFAPQCRNGVRFFALNTPQLQQMLQVAFSNGLSLGNSPVEDRLGKGRFVAFIVSEAPVTVHD
jgi:hypothetical protein